MTLDNFSQNKGIFKIPNKEGSVFTVNLPDGSSKYILLQKLDDLVGVLQENYQGGKEPINSIEELDGLISVLKQIDDEIEDDDTRKSKLAGYMANYNKNAERKKKTINEKIYIARCCGSKFQCRIYDSSFFLMWWPQKNEIGAFGPPTCG